MKRIVSLLLIFAMVLCFAACGEHVEQQPDNPVSEASSAATSEPTDSTEPSDPENTPDDSADFVPGTDDNTDDAQTQDFSIVGTWISSYKGKEYYVFNEDGTATHFIHPGDFYKGYSYTYELKDDALYLHMDITGLEITYRYNVTVYSHRGIQEIHLYGGTYCYNGEYIDKETADDVYEHIYLTNAADAKEQWDNLSIFGNWVSNGNSIVLDTDGKFTMEYDGIAFEGKYYLEINWEGKDLLDSSAYVVLIPYSDYQTNLRLERLEFLVNYDENKYYVECEEVTWDDYFGPEINHFGGQFVKQVLD